MSVRVKIAACGVVLLVGAAFVRAQSAQSPMIGASKGLSDYIKGNLLKAAAQMSEENYGFRPTPDVRSFGQLIGHIADANYMICASAQGEKAPAGDIEKTKTSKADLVKALGESFSYCDKIYEGLTEAKAMEIATVFGRQQPRLAALGFNTAHNFEHYGNVATYMRLKGLVPPSSQKPSM